MFLTTNCNAFINIEFKQPLKISKIIFYNYNNNIYKDCATKGILIYFYYNKKSNKTQGPIYLYMPPGEENIDYGQTLLYPFDNYSIYANMLKDKKKYLGLNNFKMIYNEEYNYYSPFLPSGFILKIEMMSNYGNKEYIGIDSIQLFDEDNNEIQLELSSSTYKSKLDDYKNRDYFSDSSYEIFNVKNNNDNNNNSNLRIFIMPESKRIYFNNKPLFLCKYHNFNDANNDLGENRAYFIFKQYITLSRICIYNYYKKSDIATKDIKILLDDAIIFEGELKNKGIKNDIFFCDYDNFSDNVNDNDIVKNLSNSKILNKGIKMTYNRSKNNNVILLGQSYEFKKSKNIYKGNEDRYKEYEDKNGVKILKLNSEI
jgi:hypothetical protein